MAHQMQSRRCIVYCDLHTDTLWKRNAATRAMFGLCWIHNALESSCGIRQPHNWLGSELRHQRQSQTKSKPRTATPWWQIPINTLVTVCCLRGLCKQSHQRRRASVLQTHRWPDLLPSGPSGQYKMHACGPTGPAAENRRRASGPVANVMPCNRVTWYVKTFRNVNYVCWIRLEFTYFTGGTSLGKFKI